MNIILFNVTGRVNKVIELYNYEAITDGLEIKMKKNIEEFDEKYKEYEIVEYNPVIEYKDKLSKISISQVESESDTFRVVNKYLKTGELENSDLIEIKNLSEQKELPSQVSFYVIVYNDKFYFRKQMNNAFLKETKLAFEYNYEADIYQEFNKKLMVMESTFDFFYHVDDTLLTIRNTTNFESIASYDYFFEKKRDEILGNIKRGNYISNFEEFKMEANKKAYLRFFPKVDPSNLEDIQKNEKFLDQLENETKGEISFDKNNNSFEVSPKHTKTMIHMLTYLIGRDLENQIIIFSDKTYIKFIV